MIKHSWEMCKKTQDEKLMAIGKEERFLNMEHGKKFTFPILGTQFFTLPV